MVSTLFLNVGDQFPDKTLKDLDYGWTGWQPLPLNFCNNVLSKLEADDVEIPKAILNDCDAGDRLDISNATIEESKLAIISNRSNKKEEKT